MPGIRRTTEDDQRAARTEGEDLGRLLAFSDGVFAIAATLLALEIRVPALPAARVASDLTGAILDLLPRVSIYVLTFANISVFWMAHRRTFQHIRRPDPRILWLNTLFLMFVAFLPVSSSILGSYPEHVAAVVFYAVTLTATDLAEVCILLYASSHRELQVEGLDPAESRYRNLRGLVPLAIFALSIPVAFVSPGGAKLMWVSVFVVSVVLGRFYRRALEGAASRSSAP